MKKLLEEDTGEVPERFHQAMLAAFGQMEDETAPNCRFRWKRRRSRAVRAMCRVRADDFGG